jgi:hypothetical protein
LLGETNRLARLVCATLFILSAVTSIIRIGRIRSCSTNAFSIQSFPFGM